MATRRPDDVTKLVRLPQDVVAGLSLYAQKHDYPSFRSTIIALSRKMMAESIEPPDGSEPLFTGIDLYTEQMRLFPQTTKENVSDYQG